jgi:hypothetical protein
MEGRVMLSAAAADFMPLHLIPSQFNFDSAVTNSPQLTRSTLPTEGGFIVAPPPVSAADMDVGLPSAAPPTDIMEQTDSDSIPLVVPTTNLDATYSGGLNDDSEGIRPSVIPVWGVARLDTASAGFPLYTTHSVNLNRNEGGAISVESLLAGINAPGVSQPPVRIASILTAVADSESAAVPRGAADSAAANSDISGELARAIAFEMAGGEPTEPGMESALRQPRGAGKEVEHPDSGELLPPNHARRPATNSRAEVSVVPVEEQDTTEPRVRAFAASFISLDPSNALTGRLISAELAATTSPSKSRRLQHGGDAGGDDSGRESARREVFDTLGVDEETAKLSLAQTLPWRGTLNAAPLLMILALERIAASNSRRADRQESLLNLVTRRWKPALLPHR